MNNKYGAVFFSDIDEERSNNKYGAIPFDFSDEEDEVSYPDFEIPSEEDTERDIERAQARLTSRIGETALGAPGDIASLISHLFGIDKKVLPTSSDIREFSEKASQGYLAPQNEFEGKIDEVISDITSMSLPGTGPFKFARNIGIPIVANLAKEGLKYGDASERTQAYGKVGSMVALDLLSRRSGGIKGYLNSLFKQAEEAIPKGLSVNASKLEKSLGVLEKELSKGGARPSTKKSLEKVSEIKNEIRNGKIDAKRLSAYRPSINEAIAELGGFQMEVPKKLKPQTIRNLNQVKSEVIKTLDEYGQKFNPEFLKYNRAANEGWAAYENSNKIANFLRDKVPYSPKSKATQALFSLAPHAAILGISSLSPATGAGAVAGAGIYNSYKVLDRVVRSPTLRKYYSETLKSAIKGNVTATAKNLKNLDNEISKSNLDHLEEEKEDKEE